MPVSNAERQKAFRDRRKQQAAGAFAPAPLPAKPRISVPAVKRWDSLKSRAVENLEQLRDELQEFFDERTEEWQEGERGQVYSDRIDAVESLLSDLEGLELT
jgi:hypothetical protein